MLLAEAVTKRWPRVARPVLDAVDLTVPAGALAWIGGRNGAGKTTLLRSVAGIIVPEQGRVAVCGIDVGRRRAAARRLVSFLPAGNSGLYARLDVRSHLDLWARIAYVPPSERAAEVERVSRTFALEGLAGARTDRISMGQRQRVRLAMSFLGRPRLVLLDEPRTSLDDQGHAALAAAVQRSTAEGGAVVWCSPTTADVGLPLDLAFVLDGGRLSPA